MSDYTLRLLDPAVDHEFYRQAYDWRENKRHVQPDRMSFEFFTSPDALAIGLFNGELQAVYFLHETEPGNFQAHFTSRRGIAYLPLLEGAQEVARTILQNGGREIHAWITPRNTALRRFLEALGFTPTETKSFPKNKDSESDTLQPFVKYVLYGTKPSD